MNVSIILGYTFIYFKIFVRHCYKQKVDLYFAFYFGFLFVIGMNQSAQERLFTVKAFLFS